MYFPVKQNIWATYTYKKDFNQISCIWSIWLEHLKVAGFKLSTIRSYSRLLAPHTSLTWGMFGLKTVCTVLLQFLGWKTCFLEILVHYLPGLYGYVCSHLVGVSDVLTNQQGHVYNVFLLTVHTILVLFHTGNVTHFHANKALFKRPELSPAILKGSAFV